MVTSREPAKGKRTHVNDQGFPVHLIPEEFPYFVSGSFGFIFFTDLYRYTENYFVKSYQSGCQVLVYIHFEYKCNTSANNEMFVDVEERKKKKKKRTKLCNFETYN